MKNTDKNDFTGYSESSLDEAIHNALQQAEEPGQYKVIETRSSQLSDEKRHYQVTLTLKGVL